MPRKTYYMPGDLDQLLRTFNYPGMIPEESKPLRQWLTRHGAEWNEIRFDFRVGAGEDPGDAFDAAVRKSWGQVSRMRPDAVAFRAGGYVGIIEAKNHFGNDGVWQLLGYRDELAAEQPDWKPTLIGVCQSTNSTATELAKRMGVQLFVYTFDADHVDVTAPAEETRRDGVS